MAPQNGSRYVCRRLRRLHASDGSSTAMRRLSVEEVDDSEYASCQGSPNASFPCQGVIDQICSSKGRSVEALVSHRMTEGQLGYSGSDGIKSKGSCDEVSPLWEGRNHGVCALDSSSRTLLLCCLLFFSFSLHPLYFLPAVFIPTLSLLSPASIFLPPSLVLSSLPLPCK